MTQHRCLADWPHIIVLRTFLFYQFHSYDDPFNYYYIYFWNFGSSQLLLLIFQVYCPGFIIVLVICLDVSNICYCNREQPLYWSNNLLYRHRLKKLFNLRIFLTWRLKGFTMWWMLPYSLEVLEICVKFVIDYVL